MQASHPSPDGDCQARAQKALATRRAQGAACTAARGALALGEYIEHLASCRLASRQVFHGLLSDIARHGGVDYALVEARKKFRQTGEWQKAHRSTREAGARLITADDHHSDHDSDIIVAITASIDEYHAKATARRRR